MRRPGGTDRPGRAPGSLAVDFANTLGCPACRAGDAFASPLSCRRWLGRQGVRPGSSLGVDARALARLRRFRRQVRELLGAGPSSPPPPASVRAIRRWAFEGSARPTLSWERGRWRVRPEGPVLPEAALFARIASDLVAVLTRPAARRVRRCQGPGCAHFLLARTRTQIWCSPTGCGNRARVARHYRKARQLRVPGPSAP